MNRMSLCPISFSLYVVTSLILTWLIAIDSATSLFTMSPIISFSSIENNNTVDIPIRQTPLNSSLYPTNSGLNTNSCVYYDSANRTIHLCGGSTNLSSIDRIINSSDVLNNISDKNWVLDANITVEDGATLFMNSSDVLWLKIKSSPNYPHSIVAYGNLVINGIRISSWNTTNNSEAVLKNGANVSTPRSYLLVPQQGTGQMNITDSYISGLGFKSLADTWGITYYSGSGSIIKNNIISSNFRGLHLAGNVSNVLVANNTIQNSSQHGIDLIRANGIDILGNNISSNFEHGIFCTRECKKVLVRSNYISDNGKSGVVLNQATIDSVVEHNIIQGNNGSAVAIRNSSRSTVNDNFVEKNGYGAVISQNSTHNSVIGNSISNSFSNGILLNSYSTNNTIEKNLMQNSMGAGIYANSSYDNKIIRNKISDNTKSGVVFFNASKNLLVNNNLSANTPYNYYLRPNSTFNVLRDTLFDNTTLRFFDNSSNIILENTNNRIINNNKKIPNYVYPTNATTTIITPINKNILVSTVNMYAIPSRDYVQIFSISKDFNTNQTSKNWFETSSPHLSSLSGDRRANTKYILGSFLPDTQVSVRVNDSFWNAYTSNSSGYITFVYDGYGEVIREAAGKLPSHVVTEFEVDANNRPTMAAIIFFVALITGSIAFLVIRGYLKRKSRKIMKSKH
jgi:parallel beta-helix repeat protein